MSQGDGAPDTSEALLLFLLLAVCMSVGKYGHCHCKIALHEQLVTKNQRFCENEKKINTSIPFWVGHDCQMSSVRCAQSSNALRGSIRVKGIFLGDVVLVVNVANRCKTMVVTEKKKSELLFLSLSFSHPPPLTSHLLLLLLDLVKNESLREMSFAFTVRNPNPQN